MFYQNIRKALIWMSLACYGNVMGSNLVLLTYELAQNRTVESMTREQLISENARLKKHLEDLKRDMEKKFEDIQRDVDASNSVWGFFSDIYKRLFGTDLLSRQIRELRAILNRG